MRVSYFPPLRELVFFSRLNLMLAFSLFQVLEEKIVQEYKKFRKVRLGLGMLAIRKNEFFFFFDMDAFSLQRYPGYREEKCRCEYLHQKLSHIKGLILEFEEKNRGS